MVLHAKPTPRLLVCSLVAVGLALGGCAHAAPRALSPAPRRAAWWRVAHSQLLRRVAARPDAALVFIGDSLVERWAHEGRAVWQRRYPRALNLGVGGDRTEHLLWRLEHGALAGLHPRVVVLQIGTNNLARDPARTLAAGVVAIARRVTAAHQRTTVLVLGLFPRGASSGTPVRAKIRRVNARLAHAVAAEPRVVFVDLGRHFLDGRGRIAAGMMWDFLHLTEAGYQLWAQRLAPHLAKHLAP